MIKKIIGKSKEELAIELLGSDYNALERGKRTPLIHLAKLGSYLLNLEGYSITARELHQQKQEGFTMKRKFYKGKVNFYLKKLGLPEDNSLDDDNIETWTGLTESGKRKIG